jgi:protein-S-isoprenylcysteine O-methyltransferase Ste14
MIAQSVLTTVVIALGVVFPGDWTKTSIIVPGLGLLVAGGIAGVAGVWALGPNRSPFLPPREHAQFIRHGIYAHVRHPLYLSLMLSSLGWAMIWQSWPSFVVALVLIPFFHAKVRREEDWLLQQFPEYAHYAKCVPRFLPRLHSM